jgi:hypothetical protein
MSAALKAECEEIPEADLTPERQLELIKLANRKIDSLYELFGKLSKRVDDLEKDDD